MSLIIAMKSSGGIVLGADSRGTIGDPRGLTAINDKFKKIYPLEKCGIGFAGASELGATLLDELKKSNQNNFADIDIAIQSVFNVSTASFGSWFKNIPPKEWPPVLVTLCGYRYKDGVPHPIIYLLNSQLCFAPQLCDISPCMTGVPQYAVYLVHRYYDQNIPIDKALALVEYLIAETASQDPKVGGPICLSTITPSSGYTELTSEQIAHIHADNEALNLKLKQFFLTGDVS